MRKESRFPRVFLGLACPSRRGNHPVANTDERAQLPDYLHHNSKLLGFWYNAVAQMIEGQDVCCVIIRLSAPLFVCTANNDPC